MNDLNILELKEKIENYNVNFLEMKEIYENLIDLILKKEFDNYSNLIDVLDINKINPVIIIRILRLSFINKNLIQNWTKFLEKATNEMTKNNLNVNQILKGLI